MKKRWINCVNCGKFHYGIAKLYCSPKCHMLHNNPFKGKRHSKETRRKMRENSPAKIGKENPMYGRKHSEQSKIKMREAQKGEKSHMYGKKRPKHSKWMKKNNPSNSPNWKKIMSQKMLGKNNPMFGTKLTKEQKLNLLKFAKMPKNIETKEKMSESKLGSKNYAWLGGKSFEPYSIEFNNRLKRRIRKRDDYQCQFCGTRQNGREFPVHHADYDKKNSEDFNLITLCDDCHRKTNFDRDKWQFFFETYQEIRNISI